MYRITSGIVFVLHIWILFVLVGGFNSEISPALEALLLRAKDKEHQKEVWNGLSARWKERMLDKPSEVLKETGLNYMSDTWGKRDWNRLSGMWGKRDWNRLSGMWGKRDWNRLSGMWGKRDWNRLSGMWGKRDLKKLPVIWDKIDLNKLSGMWGKQNWNVPFELRTKRSTDPNSLTGILLMVPNETSDEMWVFQEPLEVRNQKTSDGSSYLKSE
ncbi:uncharacterized protein LOC143246111 [Tachypleus tridentatus]|uniref:uncharacterized protein LOC143246111 n=1 Tax=Tachypleus tridentatus TaxID=6853 RepID=UPI003FD0C1DD